MGAGWRRAGWMGVAVLLAAGVAAGQPAASAPAGKAAPSRADALAATRDALAAELAAHGGSWAAWAERLKPFRADLERIRSTTKWPWPARDNFQFQGKEMDLLLRDDLNVRPDGQRPRDVILALHRQLAERGIDLVLMVIPDKLSVYPDYLSAQTPADRAVALPVKRLLAELTAEGVEVIDLYARYDAYRRAQPDGPPLYYDRDSHWRNVGARLAAEAIAERLARYDFVQQALAGGSPYTTRPHERTDGMKADQVQVVVDRATSRPYRDADRAAVLITGDSFSMYNLNPQQPGMLSAHVGRLIGQPVSLLCREGLSGDLGVELAKAQQQRRVLDGRRVVVWTFCARMFVAAQWPSVDLPGASASAPASAPADAAPFAARGVVVARSIGPDPQAPYTAFVLKLQVRDLRDERGVLAAAGGNAVVRVLAMKDRKVLPPSAVQVGQRVDLRLIPWTAAEATWGRVNSASLPDVQAEIDLPHYWAEDLRVVPAASSPAR